MRGIGQTQQQVADKLGVNHATVSRDLANASSESASPTITNSRGAGASRRIHEGRNLIAAKEDVAHGEWLPMLKEIGISHTMAKQLMTIGANPAIANGRNCDLLPTAARALYELSRMDPEDIEDGIETGHITPDMTIKDAKQYATGETKSGATLGESVEGAGRARARAARARGGQGGGQRNTRISLAIVTGSGVVSVASALIVP